MNLLNDIFKNKTGSTGSLEQIEDNFYGFEHEEFSEDEQEEDYERPFDADKIRIDQQMLSLKYLMDLMNDNQVVLNPDFQRNKVWTEKKRKSLLIESLMLRIPIPAFYFYENEDAKFMVIDGQQRLSTISEFINGEFKLFGLEYLEEYCGGRTFDQLEIKYQQRIFRTQLAVNILDARSPSNVVFDIFRRVNTGGVSLKPQEIRNSICKSHTRELLRDLFNSEEFQVATRHRIKDDRMDGQELVLRFFAFHNAYNFHTKKLDYHSGNIASFLDDAMLILNRTSLEELNLLQFKFKRAMKIANTLFDHYTFRKCYVDDDGWVYSNLDIINKSLYTSWSVILSDPQYSSFDFSLLSDKLLYRLSKELTYNSHYDKLLTQGTNSTRSVQYSFKIAHNLLEEVINNDL